jgi:hypothetical protein
MSIPQAEDWRKIKRLPKKVVMGLNNKNTKRLSLTIHHPSTETILLKAGCEGLEEVLV